MRGPGHPNVNLQAQQSFQFDPPRGSHLKDASGDGGSDHQPSPHQPSRGQECNRHQRSQGLHHLGSPHLPQTMGLRATGVHYQQLPQCHLGLTGQTDPNIPEEVDGIKRMELA